MRGLILATEIPSRSPTSGRLTVILLGAIATWAATPAMTSVDIPTRSTRINRDMGQQQEYAGPRPVYFRIASHNHTGLHHEHSNTLISLCGRHRHDRLRDAVAGTGKNRR